VPPGTTATQHAKNEETKLHFATSDDDTEDGNWGLVNVMRQRQRRLRVTVGLYHATSDRKREFTSAYSNENTRYNAAAAAYDLV